MRKSTPMQLDHIFVIWSCIRIKGDDSREQNWRKNVHKYWLTAKRTKPAQEKCG